MYQNKKVVDSASGVATAEGISMSGGSIQVNCNDITTGTGVVTIQVRTGSSRDWTDVVEGTIPLSAPIGLIIEGNFSAVKAESSQPGDVFKLEVRS